MLQDIDIAFFETQLFPYFEQLAYFYSLYYFVLFVILGEGSDLSQTVFYWVGFQHQPGSGVTGKETEAVQCYGPRSKQDVEDTWEGVQSSSQTKEMPQKQESICGAGQFCISILHTDLYQENAELTYFGNIPVC